MAVQQHIGLTPNPIFTGEDVTITDTITSQNITGWALKFVLKSVYGAASYLITKTTGGGGITITNGPGGVLQIAIANADTVNLTPAKYSYEISRTDSGANTVLTYGDFYLSPRL